MDDWSVLDNDLLLRANGQFLDDYIDAGVQALFNDLNDGNGMWIMFPGVEVPFKANLFYQGQAPDFVRVTFDVFDAEGNSVWDEPVEQIYEDLFIDVNPGDPVEIECQTPWVTETAGLYMAHIEVTVDGDAIPDNNVEMLEQIVFNFNGDPHNPVWYGYCGDEPTAQFSYDRYEGWVAGFHHPGGNRMLMFTRFRWFMENNTDHEIECLFHVGRFDLRARTSQWVIENIYGSIPDSSAMWIEVELDEEQQELSSWGENQVGIICYQYSGLPCQADGNPPVSGANDQMPATMYTYRADDNVLYNAAGDWMCQAQIVPSTLSSVEPNLGIEPNLPDNYTLSQNHPNPFNPTTTIDFALKASSNVELSVFDMSGRKLIEAVNGRLNAGRHSVEIDAANLPAGVYLYRLNAGDFTSTRKMILLK